MAVRAPTTKTRRPGYSGLVLSTDEYLALPPDGNRYELIDGVVVMSPSPGNTHQLVALEIIVQLRNYLDMHPLGQVFHEADVVLESSDNRRGKVYRPEMHYISAEKLEDVGERTRIAPDVVLEVISPASRGADEETKYRDYEAAGVREYWLIDPIDETMTFYRLSAGNYVAAPAGPDFYESAAVPGFKLNLAKVRAAFRALK